MTGYEPTYEMHESEPQIVETFAVLDLDRTLLASDNLVELIYDRLVEQGIPVDTTNQDKTFVFSQTGSSFSLFEHIAQEFGKERLQIVMDSILRLAQEGVVAHQDLLCSGAKELLDYLDDQQIPHAILTFGEQDLQDFKIAVTRALLGKNERDLPAMVTSVHNKAAWIAETWQTDDDAKQLTIPDVINGNRPIQAKNIVVIDDKQSNLTSDSEQIKGILVNNASNRPSGSLSTEHLAEYLEAGMPLERIAYFQTLNS